MITKILARVMLNAVDGTETIANSANVFTEGINSNFKEYLTSKPNIATKEILVDVHKLVVGATFRQIFFSLGTNLEKLCLTQHQIINFCKKHSNWLGNNGQATFFIFKFGDKFFVTYVLVYSSCLRVSVLRFEYDYIWGAKSSHHVVVPQLVT